MARQEINEYMRNYRAKNKDRMRGMWLERRYGITIDDYNHMFSEQNGSCFICGIHQSELKEILNVDHCHTTLKVRGLLCNRCNKGLGTFNDDTDLLQKAINYLRRI